MHAVGHGDNHSFLLFYNSYRYFVVLLTFFTLYKELLSWQWKRYRYYFIVIAKIKFVQSANNRLLYIPRMYSYACCCRLCMGMYNIIISIQPAIMAELIKRYK